MSKDELKEKIQQKVLEAQEFLKEITNFSEKIKHVKSAENKFYYIFMNIFSVALKELETSYEANIDLGKWITLKEQKNPRDESAGLKKQ